jgi:3-hydroxy acid dehydrogenase/malonic semialdehyde reductase
MTATRPHVVLITGASGGFGGAFARRFAALGSRLILCGRRRERLEELAKSLNVPCHIATFDVRDRKACEGALAALPAEFSSIDLLVNNAGLALGTEPAPQANLDDWLEMIDANCKGLVVLTRLVLPGMVERGRGHIINIGSTAGNYPYPGGHTYCASKAFVKQFSLALRADLYQTPVRVTNIEPGMAETDFSLVRFKGDASKASKVYADTVPLTAEDVAEAVVWAASQPAHCNINRIELMPTVQAPGPLSVRRGQ